MMPILSSANFTTFLCGLVRWILPHRQSVSKLLIGFMFTAHNGICSSQACPWRCCTFSHDILDMSCRRMLQDHLWYFFSSRGPIFGISLRNSLANHWCANYGVPHFSFPSPLPDPRASSTSYYESEHGPYGVIWTQIQQDESSSSKLWEICQNG